MREQSFGSFCLYRQTCEFHHNGFSYRLVGGGDDADEAVELPIRPVGREIFQLGLHHHEHDPGDYARERQRNIYRERYIYIKTRTESKIRRMKKELQKNQLANGYFKELNCNHLPADLGSRGISDLASSI